MLVATKTEKVRELLIEHKQKPRLNEGEVLIKVSFCGVCGSDLHAYNHSKGYEFVKMPIILGHEISGKIVDGYDSSLKNLIGKHVIVESNQYCNKCENCRSNRKSICENYQVIGLHFNGGMAEYVKTKATFVREIPNDLSMKIASLSEPMAIAVHAVKRAGEINDNHVVHVQGPGIIGFFVGLVCVHKGAKVILSGLDKDYKHRLSKCKEFGMTPHIADHDYFDKKVDVMFECSGSNKAVKAGFHSLKKGGRAVFVALYEQQTKLFLTELVRNEWSIITSYGCDPTDYEFAFLILKNYQKILNNIITLYPLTNVSQAFKDSLNQDVLKAVLSIK
jgi:L-iditol 2-dehydrogenase